MINMAMFARAVRRPLPLRAPARMATLQTKRGTAAMAAAQSAPRNDDHDNQHHPVGTGTSWREEFWRHIPVYQGVSTREFLSYRWSVSPAFVNNTSTLTVLFCVLGPIGSN